MKFNRALISRYLLATMVSLLLYSIAFPSELQKEYEFEKDEVKVQIQEKFKDSENNLLRSGTEAFSSSFGISSDLNYVSFEHQYHALLTVQFAQSKTAIEQFVSSQKIYLQNSILLI